MRTNKMQRGCMFCSELLLWDKLRVRQSWELQSILPCAEQRLIYHSFCIPISSGDLQKNPGLLSSSWGTVLNHHVNGK